MALLQRITRLVYEEKGLYVDKEIQIVDWLDSQLEVLLNRVKNSVITINFSHIMNLLWDLQLVRTVLMSLRLLQVEELSKENSEKKPDSSRLKALESSRITLEHKMKMIDGLKTVANMCLSLNFVRLNIKVDEAFEQVKDRLRPRLLGEYSSVSAISELVRFHPKSSSVPALELLHPANLFDLSSGFDTFHDLDEELVVVRSTLLYLLLETVLVKNDFSENSPSAWLRISSELIRALDLPPEYGEAVAAFWFIDNRLHLNTAVKLLSELSMEKLFPGSILNSFFVIKALLFRHGYENNALEFVKRKGISLTPISQEDARLVVDTMLKNGRWKDALAWLRMQKSRRVESNKWSFDMIQRIILWIISNCIEEGTGGKKLIKSLLQYPLNLSEQNDLQKALLALCESQNEPEVRAVSSDLLVSLNLLKYKIALSECFDHKYTLTKGDDKFLDLTDERLQQREQLIKHHEANLPFNLTTQESHLLPLVGTVIDNLPRKRKLLNLPNNSSTISRMIQADERDNWQSLVENGEVDVSRPGKQPQTDKELVILRQDELNLGYIQ